jgi:phenylacetate-CoA ligase
MNRMGTGLTGLRLITPYSWASRDGMRDFQARQLRRLVGHAYANVPYYRSLFEHHGLQPGDIRGLADLKNIPITSKRDLQGQPPKALVARGVDPEHLIVRSTSGSTGEPFVIRRNWLEERTLGGCRLRALHYFGLKARDKLCKIVQPKPVHSRDDQTLQRLFQGMGLYRSVRIDCLAAPEEIVNSLHRHRPDSILALAGVLCRVAEFMSDEDRRFITPRFIVVGSDVLTPSMRRKISDGFASRVFDFYASHEFHLIAWECSETGALHVSDDTVIVEVLKDGRPACPGERGEVVATGLCSYTMPFIRYRLGDIVTQGEDTCACGLNYSTISKIQGRMIDYFPLPEGRVIHPYEVLPLLRRGPEAWFRQYQMIQERKDRILFRAVAPEAPRQEDLEDIERAVEAWLGPGVEFKIVLVPDILPDPSGKYRVSRSLVRSTYDAPEEESRESR